MSTPGEAKAALSASSDFDALVEGLSFGTAPLVTLAELRQELRIGLGRDLLPQLRSVIREELRVAPHSQCNAADNAKVSSLELLPQLRAVFLEKMREATVDDAKNPEAPLNKEDTTTKVRVEKLHEASKSNVSKNVSKKSKTSCSTHSESEAKLSLFQICSNELDKDEDSDQEEEEAAEEAQEEEQEDEEDVVQDGAEACVSKPSPFFYLQKSRSSISFSKLVRERGARSGLRRVVASIVFDAVMFTVVILNAIYIGLEVDFRARNSGQTLPIAFDTVESLFCAVFTTELFLRWAVFETKPPVFPRQTFVSSDFLLPEFDGGACMSSCHLFVNRLHRSFCGSVLNCFDIVLVVMQLVDELDKVFGNGTESSSITRNVLVYLRLVRIFRILRIVRFLEQLSNLLYLVFASLWAFFWTLVLLAMLTHVTGTFFTHVVAEHVRAHPADAPAFQPFFGSLGTSEYALFSAIMGGVDWIVVAEPLFRISLAMPIMFCVYITFCVFVLLNLVTGVFVESAHRIRENDRKKELDRGLMSAATKAGICMDDDVSDPMFRELLKRNGMNRFLQLHDMDETTVRRVFALLRERNRNKLSLNNFITFSQRLQGLGNAFELAGLHMTGAKDRTNLMQAHERGDRERAEIRRLAERGAKDLQDLKSLNLQGSAERRRLEETLLHLQHAIEIRSRGDWGTTLHAEASPAKVLFSPSEIDVEEVDADLGYSREMGEPRRIDINEAGAQ